MTHSEIASRYGKSRNTVIYWLGELGIEPDGVDRRQHRAPAVYDMAKVEYLGAQMGWEAKVDVTLQPG